MWAFVAVAVALSSNVPIGVSAGVSGIETIGKGFMFSWAALMVFLAVRPCSRNSHVFGLYLTGLVWGGRAMGFAELVIRGENWNLVGTVGERIGILIALLGWHARSLYLIERVRVKQDYGLSLLRGAHAPDD